MGKIANKKAGNKTKNFTPLYIKTPQDAFDSLVAIAEKEDKNNTEVIVDFLRGGGKFNETIERWIADEMCERDLNRRDAIEALLFEAMFLIKHGIVPPRENIMTGSQDDQPMAGANDEPPCPRPKSRPKLS